MDSLDLKKFGEWFGDYCRAFYSADEADQKNISLKELHSKNVSENMGIIASTLEISHEKVMLAKTIGLFHDIGRFSQYAQYRTFRDNISVNHGRLGAEVLSREGVLSHIPSHEQAIILSSVKFHNAFSIPEPLDPESVFFLKMIRDSDKLDIWRIFAQFCEKPVNERETAAGLGLDDLPEYSEKILECIRRERQATLADLSSLNDFKLMQLSWVYDLNFPVSFRLAQTNGHIKSIAATLPRTDAVRVAILACQDYIMRRSATYEKLPDKKTWP